MTNDNDLSYQEKAALLADCEKPIINWFERHSHELPSSVRNVYDAGWIWSWVSAQAFSKPFVPCGDALETKKRFRAWVKLIAVNHFRTLKREGSRRPTLVDRPESTSKDPVAQAPAPGDTASREVRHKERDAVLRAKVARLPDIYRQVIELSYFRGWTVAKIAACLDLKEPAVRRRLERAQALLKERLGSGSRYLSD